MADSRQRIAILGGGMSSLATAFELTQQPNWQDRYDIVVYQLGWRLGGKGASGRNAADGRIEEHGLHVWFGCYDNAFRILRHCYEELQERGLRAPDAPFATIDRAFEPKNETPYFEHIGDEWKVWPIWFPPNTSAPGVGGPLPTTWDYIVMLAERIAHGVGTLLNEHGWGDERPHKLPKWLSKHIPRVLEDAPATLAHALQRMVASLDRDPRRHHKNHHRGILWLVDRFKRWLFERLDPELERHDGLRRLVIMIDLAVTTLRGLVADGVPVHGLGVIDGEDTRAWYRRHGALDITLESAPIRALYDLYFAYEDGDIARPSFSAAVSVGAVLRLALAYKGAVLYEMRAGMGEVVVAPIYQVLEARGVRFEFFQQVDRLELSSDGRWIARVHLTQQAKVHHGPYRPLIDVKGLPCWPTTPLYDQLDDADALRAVNLESWWSGWDGVGPRILEAGTDYDVIVLGISLAALRHVCADLVEHNDAWRDMVTRLQTNQTQAMQLWMDTSLADLGWGKGAIPVDAAPEPWDVWADRTDVMQREDWKGHVPASLQYLCGPMKGDYAARPRTDRSVPEEALDQVRRGAVAWLDGRALALWPKAQTAHGFDWSVLHDPSDATGTARLDAQYLRGNVDPTERYVLSVPGSARYRLRAGDSGYENLVLTGDWIRTDWNVGCIETTALAGMAAARATIELLGKE